MTGVMYSLLSEKITKEKKRPKEIKTNENCWNIAEFTNVVFGSTHNNSIKNKILSKEFISNTQLPSIRSLAKELEVGIITVKKAYEVLLQRNGFFDRYMFVFCYLYSKNV